MSSESDTVEHWARSRGYFNDPRVGWSPDEPMPVWLLHIPPTREHVTICRWDGPVPEHGRIVVKAPFVQAQAWIDVFDQLPDDAVRERHLVALVDIARVVEHWARVSPKWLDAVAQAKDASPWWPTSGRRSHELAQAIFMESDAAPVFAGKCKAPHCDGIGWYWGDAIGDYETDNRYTCDACHATGDAFAPVAVLLSDAADGDAAARDALLAHADLLLADGNPLGQLLNWALLLWMREPADLTHTDEAVRWLEWLTAQHELRNRSAGEYTVNVDGHEYRIAARVGMTASMIAAALNAQGGPATFSANADGLTYTLMYGTDSHIGVDLLPPPQVLEEPPPRRGHAEHIGSRLGRRLGVRR